MSQCDSRFVAEHDTKGAESVGEETEEGKVTPLQVMEWRKRKLDLRGADLAGMKLSHAMLMGINLAGANLSRASCTRRTCRMRT